MALMNSGLNYARAMNLRPGIALTAEQMAQLTSDMVWLVNQDVTLADGSVQSVLVPQVYVRVKEGDLAGSGALLAGASVNMNLTGDLTNSGTIAGRKLMQINANNIRNLGGSISADTLALQAKQDIDNIGGTLQAQSAALLSAGRDLNLTSTTQSSASQNGANSYSQTGVDRVAGLYVKGNAGALLASAGRDLNLTGAVISNAGTGQTQISAGRDLNLNTLTTASSQTLVWDANNRLSQSQSQDVGSQISAGGALSLAAGQDLNTKAAQVNAAGSLTATAGNNINITAGQASTSLDEAHQTTSKGFLSSKTTTTRQSNASTTAQASNFEGQSVNLQAGQDLNVQGSNVLADQAVNLSARGNVSIEAAQNTQSGSSFSQTSKSGVMGSGLSVTVGSRQQSLAQQSEQTTAAASTIGSTGGSVTITAGQGYTQTGSDVLTPKGDIDISAKTVTIEEARETGSQSSEQRFKQSGITVGLSGGIIDTAQAALQGVQGASGSGSDRSKALNALIAYGKGADLYEQGKAVVGAYDKNGLGGGMGADGKPAPGATAASGIKVSVSVGSSSSQSNSNTTSDTAAGSSVKAGGNVNIKATEGDLTVQGSHVQAAQDLALTAQNKVNIVASVDTESTRSTNKSSSTSVGVSFGIGKGSSGLSVDVAASRGRGQGNSDSTTYNNSHVTAGQQVSITSGADTNIAGGNVTAQQVTATVGGNLNVQSLQDVATSNASQRTTGVSLSIPVAGGGGNMSVSNAQQKSNSNYQSVGEQSGIQAGAGGFDITVKGNTDLKGAVIASNADASKNSLSTGTLSTSEIQNSMSASASSSGTSFGTGMLSGKYELAKAAASNALNQGAANQSDASTTRTAISSAQVTVGGKTTDTSKDSLSDSNGKAVSSDTSATNRTLAKADVAGLQQQAQQKQAENMLVFKAAVAIADDGLKKMAKPQLRQAFCLAEPCSNDQVANTAKIGSIAQQLMSENPDMSKEQATTLAIAAIVGKDGDPAKADPKYSGSDPNRLVEPDGFPLKVWNIQTAPVTVEDLKNLPNDEKVNSTVFANGIFNNEQRAAELAVQQTPKLDPNDPAQREQIQNTGTVLQGKTYLVSTDRSNNSAGEFITAGVEKLAEILGIPTPAAELKAQAIKALSTNNATGQTDNPINSIGHSRGTMTDVNTYNALGSEGFYNPNLKVIENNPAATQERIEQSAGKVTDPANVQIYAPKNDPVPTFVGGYGKGNSLEAIKEVLPLATTSNSVHSSPGSGAVSSNSADVNKPFSYQGLDIDQLNKAKQPQTNAILEQVQASPKPVPTVPSTDQATKLQEQVSKDSNVQMNQLLTAPTLPSESSISVPQVPSSRLEQLNQFRKGN